MATPVPLFAACPLMVMVPAPELIVLPSISTPSRLVAVPIAFPDALESPPPITTLPPLVVMEAPVSTIAPEAPPAARELNVTSRVPALDAMLEPELRKMLPSASRLSPALPPEVFEIDSPAASVMSPACEPATSVVVMVTLFPPFRLASIASMSA